MRPLARWCFVFSLTAAICGCNGRVPSERDVRSFLPGVIPAGYLIDGHYVSDDAPAVIFRFTSYPDDVPPPSMDWFVGRATAAGWESKGPEGDVWAFEKLERYRALFVLKRMKVVPSHDGWLYVGVTQFDAEREEDLRVKSPYDGSHHFARKHLWPEFYKYAGVDEDT